MSKDELRVIPKKNYIILTLVIVATLLLLYYFYMWIDAYNETKLNRPILNRYMEVINYNELNDYLVENPGTIIYVSVLEDKTIREFEKKVKNAYKHREISRDILYLDITDIINDKNIRTEMINKYFMGSLNMTDVPLIIVFDDGVVSNIYSIRDDNYDIDKFKMFLDNITFASGNDIDG